MGITLNRNSIPFDPRSPFITSGIRFGTAAITTRGLKEADMETVVDLIDRVIADPNSEAVAESVKKEVNTLMSGRPLFAG